MDARHLPTMRMMLGSIVPKSGFFHLKEGTETVAVGLSVLERGFVGIYDIVIDADLRNRGLGTQMMRHILHWGQTNGAHTAYLQVMLNNPPALHLYQKLGFREIYRYWYRQKEK
jgi:ribosomal protein S18 acetylase RimI-like enzyme